MWTYVVKPNQRISMKISTGAYNNHGRPRHTSSLAFSVWGKDLGITSKSNYWESWGGLSLRWSSSRVPSKSEIRERCCSFGVFPTPKPAHHNECSTSLKLAGTEGIGKSHTCGYMPLALAISFVSAEDKYSKRENHIFYFSLLKQ